MPTVPKDESRVPMTPNQTVSEDFKTMAYGLMRRSQEVEDFTGWKGYLFDVLPPESKPQGEQSGSPLAKAAGEDALTTGKSEAMGIMRPSAKAQFLTEGVPDQVRRTDMKIPDIYIGHGPDKPDLKKDIERRRDTTEGSYGSGSRPATPGEQIPDRELGSRDVRISQAGSSDSVWRSIFQQESSSGKDLRTSSTGAIGPGQIMPGTFKQWARPGENIRNYDDNIAVSKRMVESYHKQYGGDPARVAVAYFSGPGNVAPAGSSTPWKVDKSDGAVRTSQYVQQVIGRMGGSVASSGVPQARSRGEVWDKAGRYVGGTEETPRFKPDTGWLDAIVNARRGKRRTA